MSDRPLALIMAMRMEAKPFIERLRMKAAAGTAMPLFRTDGIILAVSGIGKDRASQAAELLARQSPRAVINCGSAGSLHTGVAVGGIFAINRVTELCDDAGLIPRAYEPDIAPGLTTKTLFTSVYPILTDEDRRRVADHGDLVDMEGAAVVRVCRAAGLKVYLIKIVTDNAACAAPDIIANIKATRHSLCDTVLQRVMPFL